MLRVDHRFTLGPALLSAPAKNRSPASLVDARSAFRLRRGRACLVKCGASCNWLFHCVIWLAWMSNCLAQLGQVPTLIAARATFALRRLGGVVPAAFAHSVSLPSHLKAGAGSRTSTYTPVRICGTGSHLTANTKKDEL